MESPQETLKKLMSHFDSCFARIALEEGYATSGDLAAAYRMQIAAPDKNFCFRTLPQIILEQGLMTYRQIDAIMREMFKSVEGASPSREVLTRQRSAAVSGAGSP